MFILNNFENKNALTFKNKHDKKCKTKHNLNYKIKFTFGSIGSNKIIKCPICKDQDDITDYNSW